MILAIGNSRGLSLKRTGFSLIELLLVLGLIGLASTLFMVNFGALIDRSGELAPEEVFREAVRQARFEAAAGRRQVHLRLALDGSALVLSEAHSEGELARFPLGEDFGTGGNRALRLIVESPVLATGFRSAVQMERREAPFVVFASDRSATPFAVVWEERGRPDIRWRIDPFSGYSLLEERP